MASHPPRPSGVVGDVGQAYTVYDRPWTCPACKADNFPRRHQCFKCKSPRPEGVNEQHVAEAKGERPTQWREAFDARTRQVYYFNEVTRETSWARPEEMGPAPYATGFFGRGAAGSTAQADLEAKITAWLARPARKQADYDLSKMQRAEGANEYNIWYGKYIGDHWTGGLGKDPAPSRCDPEADCGYTRASRGNPERAYFCIHFARGGCAKGADCTFYHHIPSAGDDGAWDGLHDVFGRERHTTHKEDMSGVGSFMSDCRTLYVGGIRKTLKNDPVALLRKNFEAWGELESLNFISRLSIAFVRYRCRLNAEFALAAMGNQSLGGGEVLNARWAYDDPNPVAKVARTRADADAVSAALVARGLSVDPTYGLPLVGGGGGDDAALVYYAWGEDQAAKEEEQAAHAGRAGGGTEEADGGGVEETAHTAATAAAAPMDVAAPLAVAAHATEGGGASSGGGVRGPADAAENAVESFGFSGKDAAAFLAEALPPPLQSYSSVPTASAPAVAAAAARAVDAVPVPPPGASDPSSPAYATWYYTVYAAWAAARGAGAPPPAGVSRGMVVGGGSNPYHAVVAVGASAGQKRRREDEGSGS